MFVMQHTEETSSLKQEIVRLKKLLMEESDRCAKEEKRSQTLEKRVDELKFNLANEQKELKDLRVKLRMSVHERNQMSGKQAEASDARRSLNLLESRRREEKKEFEKKILTLEKSLTAEKRKREPAEACVAELTKVHKQELDTSRALQGQLLKVKAELAVVKQDNSELREESEKAALQHLLEFERQQSLIADITTLYGNLASSTVSSSLHDSMRYENSRLTLRLAHLERKFANAAAQVQELAYLIRHLTEGNETVECSCMSVVGASDPSGLEASLLDLSDICLVFAELQDSKHPSTFLQAERDNASLLAKLHESWGNELSLGYHELEARLHAAHRLAEIQTSELDHIIKYQDALNQTLECTRDERDAAQELFVDTKATLDRLAASESALKEKADHLEKAVLEVTARDNAIINKLNITLQSSQFSEAALKEEIEGCVFLVSMEVTLTSLKVNCRTSQY
jgi:hypothetical protein